MGLRSLYRPISLRHDELEDVKDDPILAGGGQYLAGVAAGRPAASRADRLYYATDEDKLYRDTGAAWQEIVARATATGTFVGCRLRKNAAQAIGTGALAGISWEVEDADPQGFHAGSGNRMTVPAGRAGTYLVVLGAQWDAPPAPVARMQLTINMSGVTHARIQPAATATNETPALVVAAIVSAAVGDYFEAFAFQSSGFNWNIAADTATRFSCYRIGD